MRDTSSTQPPLITRIKTTRPTTAGASTATGPRMPGYTFATKDELIASLSRQIEKYQKNEEYDRVVIERQRKEIDEKDQMIIDLTHNGLDSSMNNAIKVLKKGMMQVRKENKKLQDNYTEISEAYTKLVLSERKKPYVKENDQLQNLLNIVH